MKNYKILFENEKGKVIRTKDFRYFVIDETGKHEINGVFDFDGLKNIFPVLKKTEA